MCGQVSVGCPPGIRLASITVASVRVLDLSLAVRTGFAAPLLSTPSGHTVSDSFWMYPSSDSSSSIALLWSRIFLSTPVSKNKRQ